MLGYTKAMLGVYGVLEKPAHHLLLFRLSKSPKNLVEGWRESLHQDPPPEIMDMYN